MKKIALFLVLIMLLGTCFAMVGCGGGGSSSSKNDEISEEVKYSLMSKMAVQSVTSGVQLYYHTHTITIREVGNNRYSVSGKATAMSSGTKYTANYSGTVEYDPSSNDYDVDIDVERFK